MGKFLKISIVCCFLLVSFNVMSQNRGMIVLKDSIEINTSIDSLYQWFLELDKNFIDWDKERHTDFRFLSKEKEVGAKIYFEEMVDGVKYEIKGKIIEKTKTSEQFVFAFKTSVGLAHIYFIGRKTENGVLFTHIEKFGKQTPFIGNIVNFLLFKVIAKKKANWDLILNDMKGDNERLKIIMEN